VIGIVEVNKWKVEFAGIAALSPVCGTQNGTSSIDRSVCHRPWTKHFSFGNGGEAFGKQKKC